VTFLVFCFHTQRQGGGTFWQKKLFSDFWEFLKREEPPGGENSTLTLFFSCRARRRLLLAKKTGKLMCISLD
jgi:hypothetical protein